MPNVKGRVRKGKTKSKVDDEEKVPEEVEAGMEMAEPDGAEDIEGKDDDAENNDDNAWQTKAELEALEAEINAESLVLTRAKSSREPPSSLILPLLPYQKEFLSWAIEQETGLVRGGILADEMGLGKTLQAVSLIVTHPREGQILGPDDGVVMPSSVKTVPAPSMKLKLPSHMAARGNIEQCKSLRSATDDGEPLGAAVPATSKPHSAATAECLKQDVDMNDDEPSAVASDTPQKTSPTETTQAQQPAASTSKAMQGIEEDTEAACTTPKPEPPKGKAVGKKGKSTKKSKGKASATEAPATEASPASAQVPPDAETAEGDAATPASGSGDPAKTKKSPKSKVKKPRVDPMLAAMEQAKTCRVEDEDGGDQPFCNTTLVVSPVVAAMQWRQEILRYMAPGSINVLLYHGTNRADTFTRKQLEAADIVLTTYSILEVDYRRNVMAPKATCSFCGKKFQPERLKVHLRYFCGPWAEKTEAQARQEKKRAPWMMRGGGSKGKGGKQDGKDKGKGSAGASTSAAAQAEAEGAEAEATEAAMDEDEATEEDTEMQVLPDGRSPKMKPKSRARLATGRASAKNKAAAATAKGKGGGKKAKGAAAGTSAEAGKKAKARKPPAKKQKTAVAQDDSDAPSASGTDDDDDCPLAVPVLLPQQTGKVTRSRSASLAAATAAPEPDSDFMDATDTEPMPPTRKTRAKAAAKPPPKVGAKRKRTAAKKPAPKRGRAPAKRGGGSGSDGSETDWAPESEDEQQAEMDAVVSDSDLSDEAAVLSDGGESEVEVGEEEEDDDVVVVDDAGDAGRTKGKGKGKGKGKKGEVDEEELQLEREVEAAANKMIAKAQKERDQQVQGKSLLHQIRWRRIVLDEAHCIKDRRCNTAQSAFALQARYRWCLTGTPLQNRVNELYSLIRFLRLHPFSHYFADKTKCCSLDFPFKNDLRRCDLCGGSRMSHYCWWNRRIANPIKYNGYEGRGRTAMLILKHQILPVVLLRRTKLMCAADLALPPRTVILRKDPFDRQEEDFYEALYTQSQAAFGGYVESGTLLNNYAHIFDLLIRLRQAVNHPYLVVYSATGGRNDSLAALPGAPDASAVVEEATADDASQPLLGVCGICHDPLEDGIPAACGHSFCRVCVTEYLDNSVGATACPSCQRPLTIDLTAPSTTAAAAADAAGLPGGGANGAAAEKFKKRSIMNRINTRAFQSSTKLEALNEAIQRMLAADPSAKCIVFSQFTSMLDLAQYRLQQTGVRCVRLEGSMTLIMRNRMIQSFNEEPGVTCFLMSLKAGGVALNLTVASHVMLMDPWWNPAVEQQAQDRIHRLGQYKPITVTRFVIAGTIEERILKLQEKKRLVFEGTVGRDAEALGKLTVDDLRFLFG